MSALDAAIVAALNASKHKTVERLLKVRAAVKAQEQTHAQD